MSATVDTFGIGLPPDWVRVPLEDGDFDAFVRGQRDRLRREAKLSRTAERQFEVLMRGLRNDCDSAGVRMIASLLGVVDTEATSAIPDEETEEATVEDESELVAASMTVSVVTRSELGSDVPLTVNTIQVAMSLDRTGHDNSDSNEASVTNLEPPTIVTVPVGEVVKLIRLHRLKIHQNRGLGDLHKDLPVFVQHFIVPIDEVGSSAAVVTFTTPMVSLARPMSELFDAMMETFEMFTGDDITEPGATARKSS